MHESLLKQVAFIGELEKLKTVQRQNRTLDKRYENSAEHSWHAALTALLLKDSFQSDIDITKVITMLLIHDVVEIECGDTFLYDEEAKAEAQDKELLAAQKLFNMLPAPQSDELLALWQEFEECVTEEAKAAQVIDALQPLINHPITRTDGENPHNMTRTMVEDKKSFIKDISPELWEVAEEMIQRAVDRNLLFDR